MYISDIYKEEVVCVLDESFLIKYDTSLEPLRSW